MRSVVRLLGSPSSSPKNECARRCNHASRLGSHGGPPGQPIEENREPGQRTHVHVDGLSEPLVASRSETAILRDLVARSREESHSQEHYELLSDIRDTIVDINPVGLSFAILASGTSTGLKSGRAKCFTKRSIPTHASG